MYNEIVSVDGVDVNELFKVATRFAPTYPVICLTLLVAAPDVILIHHPV